ncbi:hypothetical protein SAMN05216277_11041 [Halolamina pelagica]|uniref:Uncharacterized protein n=2 Tax=Haloferacaceae TaxID=1644056 RepID=A0A1I5TPN2_9EURY|nr:hypothetical protein SAMN05216277_11041 [Halolamina pelagica]
MSGSTTDPETHLVRVDTDRPPLWLVRSDDDGDRPTASRRDGWRDSIIVDDADRAGRISVADSVDRDAVESFFAATEFDAEAVYVEMGEVRACFRLDLCHLGWSSTGISTDYTRESRPYTDHCEADAWVIEARLIRIPDPLDADEVTSYSSSIGTGVCDRQHAASEGGDRTEPSPTDGSPTRTETPPTGSGGEQ